MAKVDAFQAQVEAVQQPWLACRRGCDGCCRLRRTAWAVEVDHLRTHLRDHPTDAARLRARRDDPEVVAGRRCVFLDDDGGCAAYPARPLICRTHGPALRTEAGLSWCHLNFSGLDATAVAERVPATALLEVARLDTLLAVVNARFLAQHPGPARLPLDAAIEEENP